MPNRRFVLNRRRILAAMLPLPLLAAGCEIDTINSFPTKNAHVRFVNALPNAPAVNVSVDGGVKWPALPFEAMTAYEDFSNESHTFSVALVSATSTLVQANFNLSGESSYTLIVFGTTDAPSLAMLSDDTVAPTPGRYLIRVANVAFGSAGVDAYITSPGADLNTVGPSLSFIVFGASTGFLQLSSGSTQQLRLTLAGTKSVIYDSGPRVFNDNTATDAIVYTRSGGQLSNVMLADINGANQQVVLNSTLTQVKVIHAAFQSGNVNATVDLGVIQSDMAYPSASPYNIVSPGQRTISFQATSAPEVNIASLPATLAAATDTSVFVTGFAGNTGAVLLTDSNFGTTNGNPRLRIVNASPDAPPLDVSVNGTRQVASLPFPAASSYLSFAPATYAIVVSDPTTGAALLTLPSVTLSSAQTSTLYLTGPVSQLAGLVTRDN